MSVRKTIFTNIRFLFTIIFLASKNKPHKLKLTKTSKLTHHIKTFNNNLLKTTQPSSTPIQNRFNPIHNLTKPSNSFHKKFITITSIGINRIIEKTNILCNF